MTGLVQTVACLLFATNLLASPVELYGTLDVGPSANPYAAPTTRKIKGGWEPSGKNTAKLTLPGGKEYFLEGESVERVNQILASETSVYRVPWDGAERLIQIDPNKPPTLFVTFRQNTNGQIRDPHIELDLGFWKLAQSASREKPVREFVSGVMDVKNFRPVLRETLKPGRFHMPGVGLELPGNHFAPLEIIGWKGGNAIAADATLLAKARHDEGSFRTGDIRFAGARKSVPLYEIPFELLAFNPRGRLNKVQLDSDAFGDIFASGKSNMVLVSDTAEIVDEQILRQARQIVGADTLSDRLGENYFVISKSGRQTLEDRLRAWQDACWNWLTKPR